MGFPRASRGSYEAGGGRAMLGTGLDNIRIVLWNLFRCAIGLFSVPVFCHIWITNT